LEPPLLLPECLPAFFKRGSEVGEIVGGKMSKRTVVVGSVAEKMPRLEPEEEDEVGMELYRS
jgi:hypothetical protein